MYRIHGTGLESKGMVCIQCSETGRGTHPVQCIAVAVILQDTGTQFQTQFVHGGTKGTVRMDNGSSGAKHLTGQMAIPQAQSLIHSFYRSVVFSCPRSVRGVSFRTVFCLLRLATIHYSSIDLESGIWAGEGACRVFHPNNKVGHMRAPLMISLQAIEEFHSIATRLRV